MDSWDLALLVVAGFAAVVGLVRLMNGRRRQLAEELSAEIERLPTRGPLDAAGKVVPPRSNKAE
jgi:hypothetical protein